MMNEILEEIFKIWKEEIVIVNMEQHNSWIQITYYPSKVVNTAKKYNISPASIYPAIVTNYYL